MCLAQGPQRSDAGEARTHGPSVSTVLENKDEQVSIDKSGLQYPLIRLSQVTS